MSTNCIMFIINRLSLNLARKAFAWQARVKSFKVLDKLMSLPPHLSLDQLLDIIDPLWFKLNECKTAKDKIKILDTLPQVITFIRSMPILDFILKEADDDSEVALKSLIALGQGPTIFKNADEVSDISLELTKLIQDLGEVEKFYHTIGGVVGYHKTVLELIRAQEKGEAALPDNVAYTKPEGLNVAEDTPEVRKAVRFGIEAMPHLAEIYPVGGAGDRLHFVDEATNTPKPVGELPLFGETLIGLMVRDLQAREYLYFKLFNQQITTPIAMMTSNEKDNHHKIQELCKGLSWFGRPLNSFFLFVQPLVPVITKHGFWSLKAPLKLNFKPGGHGAIWKVAQDKGMFIWMQSHNRSKAIVRQVNNPAAGIDNGLLALSGIGVHEKKKMGFASCERRLGAHEGMNILVEKQVEDGYEYGITNVEYTDFTLKGIKDIPASKDGHYSIFPSNTNILFVDFLAVQEALKKCPIPGMIINMKDTCPVEKVKGGRLESTMQNIADGMLEKHHRKLRKGEEKKLKTFITYNQRAKTIVVAKRSYSPTEPLHDTPMGCYYELLKNNGRLFSEHCGFKLPSIGAEKVYLEQGPRAIITYHPALGPLYSIIAQKIQGGHLNDNSDLSLDIADLEIDGLDLTGSLQIKSSNVMGHRDKSGHLVYSSQTGKCTLKNVKIVNLGIDRSAPNIYWKNQIKRKEALNIIIHGYGEFYASDVLFQGNQTIEVPSGYKVTAYQEGNVLKFRKEALSGPSWQWSYTFDKENRIVLKKEESPQNVV